MKNTVQLDLEYAKNVLEILKMHTSLCFEIISIDVKESVPEGTYDILQELYLKYHNANCGPFNRHLEKLIKDVDEAGETKENG